jgi:ankyrin repeat protein
VLLLLEKGSDVKAKDWNGKVALHLAAGGRARGGGPAATVL